MANNDDNLPQCNYSKYGCCPDGITVKYDSKGTNCNIKGGCEGTIYGCCPDQLTPKRDEQGMNCYNNPIGGCNGTRYGCCPDQLTPKRDDQGSNCSINPPPQPNIIGICSETKFGCCPYSDIPKSNLVGSNCPISPIQDINIIINSNCDKSPYGCCPDNTTSKTNKEGSNCAIGGCAGTIYGCCPDNKTPKTNSSGSNCNESYMNDKVLETIEKVLLNPMVLLLLFGILVMYFVYIMFSPAQRGSNGEDVDANNSAVILFLVILLIIQCCIVGLYYFYNINIYLKIKEFFIKNTTTPSDLLPLPNPINNNILPIPEITISPQVFNIPQNIYSYTDAKALCQAYGSRLANYEEVEDAYKKGGEWCNYGWSDGQMILFPTQESTYNELQKIEGHEHDCGRPGVNGGYIENDKKRFGVNCYGYKPKITSLEEELMANTTPYPLTEKDILFEKEVEFWKKQIKNILVSPFNYNTWSRI